MTLGTSLGVLGLVLGNTIWDAPSLWGPCMIGGYLLGGGVFAIRYFRQRDDDV
ncbi:hypothetical protein [Cellulosimicrobium cellulans]|uniref:hypothetical protein n=1 Tax=Cellulosimicrobium cellulans TaxID=1710 RepID=UPI003015F5AB